jgi:hypothetical protein
MNQISIDDLRRIRSRCTKKSSSTSGCVMWLDTNRIPIKRRKAQHRIKKTNKRVSVSKILYENEFGSIAENTEIEYCSASDECVNPHHAKVKNK